MIAKTSTPRKTPSRLSADKQRLGVSTLNAIAAIVSALGSHCASEGEDMFGCVCITVPTTGGAKRTPCLGRCGAHRQAPHDPNELVAIPSSSRSHVSETGRHNFLDSRDRTRCPRKTRMNRVSYPAERSWPTES